MSTPPGQGTSRKPPRSRLRRLAWGAFRCFRTALVVLLLAGAALGLFLNKVGLPEFMEDRVIAQARARGLEVQFSRLRLRWYRGIVAEDLFVRAIHGAAGPRLFAQEAEAPINPAALKSLGLRINSLRLSGGRFIWPLRATNGPSHTFVLNRLNGLLLFQADDLWELRSLAGDFHGIRLELTGDLTHALNLVSWKTSQGPPRAPSPTETMLHELESVLGQTKLAGGPALRLRFRGDGRSLSSFSATLSLTIPRLDSRWLAGTNLVLSSQLIPPLRTDQSPSIVLKLAASDALIPGAKAQSFRLDVECGDLFGGGAGASNLLAVRVPGGSRGDKRTARDGLPLPVSNNASLSVELTGVETRWGEAQSLSLRASSAVSATNAALAQTELWAVGRHVRTDWGQATNVQLTATIWRSLTNWMPALLSAELRSEVVQTRWGAAQRAEVRAHAPLPSADGLRLFQTNLAWPERLQNFPFEAVASFTNVHSEKIELAGASLALGSDSSRLRLESSGKSATGEFSLNGQLDLSSRRLTFSGSSGVDPETITPLLSTNAQMWLTNFALQTPPRLEAQGRVVLPAWTNRQPDWTGEVMPMVELAGKIALGPGACRGVTFTSAGSPFTLTNLLWQMPAFKMARPEGALEAEYSAHLLTRDFHSRVHSQIDLQAVKPILQKEAARRALDFFLLSASPNIQAEIWGNWRDLDRLDILALVAATNFTFRGEAVKDFQTRLHYTNQLVLFTETQLHRENRETGTVAAATLDLRAEKLHLTNGFSTLNPYAVARAISRPAITAIEPFQFVSPPTVHLHGTVDLKKKRSEENLHFEIVGQAFHWRQFHLEQVAGTLDWVGQTLALTRVEGAFHTGRLTNGAAHFDFTVPHETEFSFQADFEGADLREVATLLTGRTNKLEGSLTGELVITRANTADLGSWQGSGHLKLHDGLIWDIPMFGLFSPVLNGFVPGLGNSRANEATASFVVTNGVFFSKDLEIHATMMRMQFKGTVGLNRRVDARVEAELLRDLPAVGFLISKVFWPVTKLFEYKVTGTLLEPKAEPLYVLPKLLLMPLHPFKTLKSIFQEEPKEVPGDGALPKR